MIYLIGAISLVSLILNYLTYRHFNQYLAIEPVELTIERILDEPESEVQQEVEPESTDEYPPVTIPMVQEVYQGYVNRTNIPMADYGKPLPPVKRENPGPLERPQGFV